RVRRVRTPLRGQEVRAPGRSAGGGGGDPARRAVGGPGARGRALAGVLAAPRAAPHRRVPRVLHGDVVAAGEGVLDAAARDVEVVARLVQQLDRRGPRQLEQGVEAV